MSSGNTVLPRKETIYDGPDVDLFKPRELKDAREALLSKETVHDGEVPEFITRRFSAQQVANLQKPQTETVYHGQIPEMFLKLGRIAQDLVMPDRETIYSGPEMKVRHVVDVSHADARGNLAEQPAKETVYDENTFVRSRIDTSASRSLVTRLVQRASVRFFAVAVLSLIELYLCRDNLTVAISSGIMFLTFSVVGFYTFKMNLKALLLAIGLYTCSTVFMGVTAIVSENMLVMIVPLLSRGFMIYNLLRTYGLLVDLHLLEAEIY
jgi:hypothetical protein